VGSAFTIIPIQRVIAWSGYESAFLWFGLGQGLLILAMAPFLHAPSRDQPAATPVRQARRSSTPAETLRSPLFWLLYFMMALVSAGGLMATAQLAPIAHEFNVAGVPVSLLGLTLPALTFALSIDRVLNGVTRPFFGWVSDRIGREVTMFIAFSLEAVGILALGHFGRDPLLFVLLGGHGVLRLGRDLQPVPRALHRLLRLGPTPRPMPACSTPPRAWRACWCRSPACWSPRPATGHLVFVIAAVFQRARRGAGAAGGAAAPPRPRAQPAPGCRDIGSTLGSS
jgi:MFS family permease